MIHLFRTSALVLLCSASGLSRGHSEEAAPADYLRYVRDEKSDRLEIPIKSFALPDARIVDLVGVVHIADAAYYADLNRRFREYDAVLFELVGDPTVLQLPVAERRARMAKGQRGMLGTLYRYMSDSMDLSLQLNEIDYSPKNMMHADASNDEFNELQKKRGESLASLMVRSMQLQLDGELGEDLQTLEAGDLLRIMLSPDSASDLKRVVARTFHDSEKLGAKLEGEDGSAIITDRNAVALRKLREVIADPTKKRIAIFYGALHMPKMEVSLGQDFAAKLTAETWLAAWSMKPAAAAESTPADDKTEPPK
jgi:hypothetical protein